MAYSADSFVADEVPTTAKWNKLWNNDAAFNDGSGFASGALGSVHASLVNGVAVQQVGNQTGAVATGTTVLPNDDTIPQNTEGDQYLSQAITPKSTSNILVISVIAYVSTTVAGQNMGIALFQDSTANALAAGRERTNPAANLCNSIVLTHRMTAGTTSSTTFKVRIGGNGVGTTTLNGESGARQYGGVFASCINITEYKA